MFASIVIKKHKIRKIFWLYQEFTMKPSIATVHWNHLMYYGHICVFTFAREHKNGTFLHLMSKPIINSTLFGGPIRSLFDDNVMYPEHM